MNSSVLRYHSLLKRISAVRKKEKFLSLITGLFIFISISLIILLFELIINIIFWLNSSNRIILDTMGICFTFIIFIYFVLHPIISLLFLKQYPSNITLADRIGEKFPSIKDRLVNALQIFNFYNRNPEGYSVELVDVALTKVDEESKDKNFSTIINRSPLKRYAKFLAITTIIFGISWLVFSANLNKSLKYLLHPFTSFEKKANFKLIVSPGNIEVLKNENVELKVIAEGQAPQQLVLHIKKVNNGNEVIRVITKNQNQIFQYIIENIRDSTAYYFSAESMETPQYLISVIELPMVRNLQLRLTYPSYSRIETRFLDENVGDISALKGSVADIKIQANKTLSDAQLVFDHPKSQQLSIQGNSAKGRIYILFDDTYYIALKDQSGRSNRDPIKYRINIIEDNYPSVKIIEPGRDVDITEEMLIPLTIEAEDDFGFSRMQLAYKILKGGVINDDSFNLIPLKLDNYQLEKIQLNYNWDLTSLNLFPEDIVTYYVEVFDNDNVSGPKSAKSLTYNIHFPSIYEIYTEVQQEHQQTFETIEGMYEQSKELKEKVSDLVQEMKRDPNLNWEEKKQLEDVIETQQQMQQALEEVEQKLEDMIERMEKNDLISIETLKKYQELEQLLQEVMTDKLKEVIKELQKSMENIDPEELKKAVEKLNISQEDFLKNLEKTLSILKRLQIEQRLDEVTKKAEQLLKEQKELLEKAKNTSHEDPNKLAKEQQDIQQKTEGLKKDIVSLKESMSQFADMPTDRIDAAMNMMEQEQLIENMKQASQMYQASNMNGAQSSGQRAQHTLSELADILMNAKQELTITQKQQVMSELMRVSKDLLSLSMKQEEILKSARELSRSSPQLGKIADKQEDLVSGLTRVAERTGELSNKTFFITPEIARAIGQSLYEMQESLKKLEERDGLRASQNQGKAMASLNEAIKQLHKSMNDLAGSGSVSGLQEMLNRLSQMTGKQQGINDQMMELGFGQQPLSLQQQAAMARLAAEQAALKKSLDQLQQEFGNRSEILGRLDKIADEMDKVVKDLQSKNVNRQTIDRQQKILSRLLDAQKSIQTRDYSRKRKAETGKQYFAKSPGQLPENLGEKDYELIQDLLKALKQGYTRDYQELIKKYFEALVNEKNNN